MHTASNVPFEVRQRGGATAPRTWLILALLTAGLGSAATNVYLFEHRELVVVFKQTEPSSSADDSASGPGAVADSGELNDGPCDLSWTLCWQRT